MGISNVASNLRPGICTSTTRPTTPYEGQMVYETDTDMVAIWNGLAWRYIAATTPTNGTVLKMSIDTTTTVQSTTSGTFADTALSISITPYSSTNKILAIVSGLSYSASNSTGAEYRIVRGATEIALIAGIGYNTGGNLIAPFSIMQLDSPATTSSTTYTLQLRRSEGAGTVYFCQNNSLSSLTLMEIAA